MSDKNRLHYRNLLLCPEWNLWLSAGLQGYDWCEMCIRDRGYTVPQKLVNKWGMANLRFYMSSTNLFVLSKFKDWDVELAGNVLNYPLQRVFNIGVNVSF